MKCNKCGGTIGDGIAFRQDMVRGMGVPDFPGNTVDSRGQTITLIPGEPRISAVKKCSKCGHSFVNTETEEGEIDT